jgi:hypothetical protein
MVKVNILCLLITLSHQSADPALINGRFIAFDILQSLTNPHEPTQSFIVEVQDKNPYINVKLLRVVYFAPTNGLRGGAKFLSHDILDYKNVWKLKLHQPLTAGEKSACSQYDNFWRVMDGTIDIDEKKEPILRYRSTQFEAEIKFEKITEMPCMILDSIQQ